MARVSPHKGTLIKIIAICFQSLLKQFTLCCYLQCVQGAQHEAPVRECDVILSVLAQLRNNINTETRC